MYPAKPVMLASDSMLMFGRALFAYLLCGHVEHADVYGMLDYDELALAHHASVNILQQDASPIAIDTVVLVRYRIAVILARRAVEDRATVPAKTPEDIRGNARILNIPAPKPLAPVSDIAF